MSENSLKNEKKKKRSSGNFKERKTDFESTLIKHTEGQKWYSYQVGFKKKKKKLKKIQKNSF